MALKSMTAQVLENMVPRAGLIDLSTFKHLPKNGEVGRSKVLCCFFYGTSPTLALILLAVKLARASSRPSRVCGFAVAGARSARCARASIRPCESGGLVVNDACDWWETRCDLVSIRLGAISATISSATSTLGLVGAPWWSIIGSASTLFSEGWERWTSSACARNELAGDIFALVMWNEPRANRPHYKV